MWDVFKLKKIKRLYWNNIDSDPSLSSDPNSLQTRSNASGIDGMTKLNNLGIEIL